MTIIDDKYYDAIYVSKEKYDVDLSFSKNPVGPSPKALERIEQAKANIDSYPSYDCSELREKIALREKISPSSIIFGAGGDGILQDLVNVFITDGTNLVLPCLTYTHPIFATVAKGGYAKIADVNADFSFSWNNIKAEIDDKTKLICFANPNNPTGLIESREDILSFVQSTDIPVIVDEAIIDYGGETLIQDVKDIENLIVVRSFSKGHGLNGLRIGYAVAADQIINKIVKTRHPFVNSSLSIEAATAAIDDEDHVTQSITCAREEYIFLKEHLEKRGFKILPSQANCFLAKIPNQFKHSTELCEKLKSHSCNVADGAKFFGIGDRYIRIASRTRDINEKFLKILDKIIKE